MRSPTPKRSAPERSCASEPPAGRLGRPLDRPSDEVLRDVRWGKVSIDGAREAYGVVITADLSSTVGADAAGVDDAQVDEAATQTLRAQMRGDREENRPFFDRGPGYAQLSGDGSAAAAVDWL